MAVIPVKSRGKPNSRPIEWQTARLGEVAEVSRGISWSREQESQVPLENSVPVVRIGNVQRDGFRMEDTLYLNGVSTSKKGRQLVTNRTLVMVGSNGNPDRVGNVFLANQAVSGHLLASFLIRIDPGLAVSERYLSLILRSSSIQERITESTAGSTGLRNLSLEWLRGLQLALPPLLEQRAIAAVLDSIAGAIERTDDVIAATERLRDALLNELLTRGVPGWHSAWKDVPGLGAVPASWEVVRLGDVADVASGQVDPRGEAFQSLLFVAPDDIESDTGRLISRRTAADVRAISGKYWFNADDVLFSKIRPYLNKVYVPSEQGLCSADIYPLRPLAKIGRGYLALTLLSEAFAAYTRTCSDRTGIPKVNRVDLMKYRFALPPLEEQQAIAGMLDAVDEAAERARGERTGLQGLQASASDALLTGRVRVGV